MIDEVMLVALGGLLHDIGKFEQRGVTKRKRHQEHGYDFLRKYTERYLKDYDILPLFAKYHHKTDLIEFRGDIRTKNLLKIVCEADSISSGERKSEDEIKFDVKNPLESIFSSVSIGKDDSGKRKGDSEKRYYPLEIFSSEAYFHPVRHHENSVKKYAELFENFEKEFENLVKKLGFNYNLLMVLLEKYTSFIPAMLTESNDISLYDHLKTTSAIALCMYHYHYKDMDRDLTNVIEDRTEKKYLLIGGDISGIQDFIYTITSKGALKYLRARSLFIELLTEDTIQEILKRLELTRANVLFAGGGRFYVLAYNTEKAKEEIKKIAEEVNRWLFKKFWGRLYLALDFLEVNGEELSKFRRGNESLWDIINDRLREAKLRKFLDIASIGKLIENYIPDDENYGECDICKSPEVLTEEVGIKVCETCKQFNKMGGSIPKAIGFARVSGSFLSRDRRDRYDLPFSSWYPLMNIKDISNFPENTEVFLKHLDLRLSELNGSYEFIPLNVSDYYAKDEKGDVKEFDELAKEAMGAKKLAVLRMDVDDLGKIFGCGLKGIETISRVATLSRFLSHFFKNCIDLICRGRKINLDLDAPRIKSGREKKEVVVVYSGGDDLFIVGAWDHVFELAFEIEDAFRKYVGENPNITISAGYGIFDPKFPLYRMAEITGRREERAKEEGEEIGIIECSRDKVKIKSKGRVFLLDRLAGRASKNNSVVFKESYKWEEFRRVWKEYVPKIYDENKVELRIRRSLIRRILDARKEYLENPKGFKWQILLIYYLSKARRWIDVIGKIAVRDADMVRKGLPQDIYYIDVPLRIVDFAVRGGD
ncbi:MAG: type III-A CRISPR-associated protein Cas10/Csm1 [Archaeoglobus sp.]|nr:MAG: type III-A CRISPR-associated protein Cas10/Csm1 [Archaeoglobus sp.]